MAKRHPIRSPEFMKAIRGTHYVFWIKMFVMNMIP